MKLTQGKSLPVLYLRAQMQMHGAHYQNQIP